jgi:hypothetical protein
MEVKRMKKFRNLFMVLALALVFVFGVKAIAAQARSIIVTGEGDYTVTWTGESDSGSRTGAGSGELSTSGNYTLTVSEGYTINPGKTGEGETDVEVVVKAVAANAGFAVEWFDIATAELYVYGDAPLYYQLVKSADADADRLKAVNWIPVVEDRIDLSAYSKTVYVAITDDPTATTCKKDNIVTVEFDKSLKIKASANFACEIPVDPKDPAYESSYEVSSGSGKPLDGILTFDAEKTSPGLTYQWRKSANDNWHEVDEEVEALVTAYKLLRASNGTLYIRGYKEVEGKYYFPTKEVKVKIPKGANAPTIKVDYTKNIITIPKQAQVYVTSSSGNDETHYVEFKAGATTSDTATVSSASGVPSGPSKALKVSIDDLVEYLGTAAGGDITLYVRTEAASKKYGSYFTTFTVKVPAAAPNVGLEWDTAGKKLKVTGGVENVTYEFEKSAGKFNKIAAAGFAPATGATEVKIRIVGDKSKETFASKTVTVKIPDPDKETETAKNSTVTFVTSLSGANSASGGATIQVGSVSGSDIVFNALTGDKTTVENGKDLYFKVSATPVGSVSGEVTVKNGDTPISETSGYYTLQKVDKDTTLTIIVFYGD